jgi:hypothetical protein
MNELSDGFTAATAAVLALLPTRRKRHNRPGRTRTVTVIAVLSVGTAAVAYWTIAGSASGTGPTAAGPRPPAVWA